MSTLVDRYNQLSLVENIDFSCMILDFIVAVPIGLAWNCLRTLVLLVCGLAVCGLAVCGEVGEKGCGGSRGKADRECCNPKSIASIN